MSRIEAAEVAVHGRGRNLDNDDELHFGVHTQMLYAKNSPGVAGAQWTGVVTQACIGRGGG